MNEALGSLSVLLKADSSNLNMGVNSAIGSLKRFAIQAASLVGVGLTIKGVWDGLTKAIHEGSVLHDMAVNTRVAAGDLMVLRRALEEAGASASSAQMMIAMMQRQMEMASYSKIGRDMAKEMGLNLGDVKKLPILEQIETLGGAISKIKDPSKQMVALMQFFGRSGYMMRGFFQNPNAVKEARKVLGELPDIMNKTSGMFDKIDSAMYNFRIRAKGVFAGIAEGMLPIFDNMVKRMDQFDLTGIGRKIGRMISTIGELIMSGKIPEMLRLVFQIGIEYIKMEWEQFGKWILTSFVFDIGKVGDVIVDLLVKAMDVVITAWEAQWMWAWNSLKFGYLKVKEYVIGLSNEEKIERSRLADAGALDITKIYSNAMKKLEGAIGNILIGIITSNGSERRKRIEDLTTQLIGIVDMAKANVESEIDLLQEATKYVPENITDTEGGGSDAYIKKYASAAVYGTKEAYQAEMGITKDMAKVAQNTGAQLTKMGEMVEAQQEMVSEMQDLNLSLDDRAAMNMEVVEI